MPFLFALHPGSYPGHEDKNSRGNFFFDLDAQTFARWGIDYLKVRKPKHSN